ncbi:MAG: MBL fold metallo-hydrolase [Pseudomonadales bacterium]
MRPLTLILLLTLAGTAAQAPTSHAAAFCGDQGVWIQILGGGGPELNDGQASASYVVFIDNRARLLVDAGAGASANFDRAGADFADLEAVVFTNLQAHQTSEFPAFIKGSMFAGRDRSLPVFGPDGAGIYPDTQTFVERLIGAEGAFPYLADFLTFRSSGGYRVNARTVPAAGTRRWAQFGSEHLQLSAIPVHHGPVPALAWRVDVGDQSIVFTGNFNNRNNVVPNFARGVDALVIHHSIPHGTRGEPTELHVTPGQIGQIARQAEARMVILGHRMMRTRGLESLSRNAIEEHYTGPLIFGNDLECWGL